MYTTIKLRHILAGLFVVAFHPLFAQTLSDGQTVVKNALITPRDNQLLLTMDVCLDELRLKNKQSVVLHPVLTSLDNTRRVAFDPMVIDSHAQYVLYQRGQSNEAYSNVRHVKHKNKKPLTVPYVSTIPYESWMDTYQLRLEEDLCGCGDLSELPYVPSLLRDMPPNPLDLIQLANATPAPVKPTLNLHGSAFINFVVNRWEMKPDYMDNRRELRKITDTLDIMVQDPNITVREVKIHGWASPESPYQHNSMLATNRAKSLTDYVRKTYDLPADVFAPAEATPENWIGLRQAVSEMTFSELPHRTEILQIIDKVLADLDRGVTNQADRDELTLKTKYSEEYRYLLQNVYPSLRRSDYDISFDIRKFTLEEAKKIYTTRPHHLSLHELWQVANTYEPYSDEYNQVVQKTLNIYPDSTVALINLANVALHQGDKLKAETLLKDAGESAEALNARAVLYILQKRYDEASLMLDRAEKLGIDVSRNREVIQKMIPYKDR